MELTAVLFDLDGTLFDHPGASRDGLRTWLATLGRELTPELDAAWFTAQDAGWAAWREGRVSFPEQRRARLRTFLPLLEHPVGDDDELDALFADGFQVHYGRAWRGYGDVEDGLAAVEGAGLAVGVLTNGQREQQRAKVAALGLADRLGPLVTAEELGVAKPDPAAFHRACGRLGSEAAATLYVGDDHVVDVLAARAAGLRALHLDRDGTGPADEPRIATLADLAGHLQG